MNIIFGRERAKLLESRYIVLEILKLNDIDIDYQCYCLVEGSNIHFKELPSVEHYKNLHKKLLENLRKKNYNICQELVSHLQGRWGGQLDTFYQSVLEYIKTQR